MGANSGKYLSQFCVSCYYIFFSSPVTIYFFRTLCIHRKKIFPSLQNTSRIPTLGLPYFRPRSCPGKLAHIRGWEMAISQPRESCLTIYQTLCLLIHSHGILRFPPCDYRMVYTNNLFFK